MPKRKARQAADPGRLAKRQSLGPLKNLRVSPLALRRYREHASYFFQWLSMVAVVGAINTELDLDLLVQEYVEQLWDHNAGLEAAQSTLAGIQHFLRHAVRLRGSWRILSVWRRNEPPTRAPPLPEFTLLALAMHALQCGDVPFAASLLVGFFAFLRTGEIITLRVSQCIFDANGHLILNLGQCKSGKRRGEEEYGIIDHPAVCTILRLFLKHRHPLQTVAGLDEHTWRRRFDKYLGDLGLSHLGLRPYSVRRGGATSALRKGMTLSQVCVRGRWANERTARIYIQEAVALLQNIALPQSVLDLLLTLASAWQFEFLR